jgi:UDP-glucose/iron transport system ATP-binding protein
MDENIIIDFHDVTFGFREQATLFTNLSLSIRKGGFYLVKGPSGAGKTTFLRLINRLENPNSGEIRFKGKPLGNYPPPQLRHSLLYIQQTPSVADGSVHENLLLPFSFKNNHHLKKPGHHELENLLKDVHLHDLELNEHAMNLSVGQLQRICLIRGILLSPEVLLLDEPTSALDRDSAGSIMELLERLNVESGLTLLIITHKAYTPKRVEPRFLMVNHGRIEESNDPQHH